jgi:hypothetical protein
LLRLKAGGTGLGIAHMQKIADAVAEFGKGAVFRGGDIRGHKNSLSQYDIFIQPGWMELTKVPPLGN